VKALSLLFVVLLIAGCGGGNTAQPQAKTPAQAPVTVEVSFSKDVQPIFAASCMPCHSGSGDAKSKYDLAKYEGIMANVVACNPDSSKLCQMLATGKMPPAGPLPGDKVEFVKKWVSQGAKNN